MTLALFLLLTGCRDRDKGLGDLDEDLGSLADSAPLAHLDAALGGGEVLDLFDDELAFGEAPDPSVYFADERAAHLALPDGAGTALSVLTYNAGLLSRRYLTFKVEVPNIDARRARMAEALFSAGHDILLLQEVWEMDDARMLEEAGTSAGYRVWYGDRRKFHRETGLVMAVREELVGAGEVQETGQYAAQWRSENFPGPNLKRGWQHWSFELAETGIELHLFDTHLTPFYTEWQTRNLQVRELGLAVAEVPEDALVLVGGDFNAGWYYTRDTWLDGEGEAHEGWWRNTAMPALLAHYGGLSDLAVLGSDVRDVALGDLVGEADASWLETPYGDGAFCAESAGALTATDCNSLYFQSYAATEFPVRMDLLWMRDGTGGARVRSVASAFVDPLDFGADGTFELSDHYGQAIELELVD